MKPPPGSDPSALWEELAQGGQRIVLLVIDGLGGLPGPRRRRSELQAAYLPHLDALAAESSCGLIEPVAAGLTPGSGPGHLALFGYHPLRYRIGRGILAALGSGFELEEGDVAARVNFARVDREGRVEDRRAGRLPTRQSRALCRRIREGVTLPDGLEWFLEPVREHRAVLVLRGPDLAADLDDTDPQRRGVAPRPVVARRTAAVVGSFLAQAREIGSRRHGPGAGPRRAPAQVRWLTWPARATGRRATSCRARHGRCPAPTRTEPASGTSGAGPRAPGRERARPCARPRAPPRPGRRRRAPASP